jgi:hypothetical protein
VVESHGLDPRLPMSVADTRSCGCRLMACVGQEIPEDCRDYNQGGNIADEMAEFVPIVQGLSRHNCSVHNA